ncbi:hypothetical protein PWT90_01120 [Aphanocladium album]|nr:hypothetical protein PWT90_01120 [Aphanocladium album]
MPPREAEHQGTGAASSAQSSAGKSGVASDVPKKICRNRHWRFLTSFYGPWLRLPLEKLQLLCNINYNMPPPHSVDPAVMFDMLKIRRLVEETAELILQAEGNSLLVDTSSYRPRRIQRIRDMACQKLSAAYRVDEIPCSLLTMHSSADLDNVASEVLRHDPANLDAKYVHFFHEKIHPLQLTECTSLEPLDDIVEAGHANEVRRTRAAVRFFMDSLRGLRDESEDGNDGLGNCISDLTGALHTIQVENTIQSHSASSQESHAQRNTAKVTSNDLTAALSGCRLETKPQSCSVPTQESQASRTIADPVPEQAIPSSLLTQLLFRRGSCYLRMACKLIPQGLPSTNANDADVSPTETDDHETAQQRRESRQLVKTFASRAKRDFMDFLSKLQYSPDWPTSAAAELVACKDKVLAGDKVRDFTRTALQHSSPINRIYKVSELFASTPLEGLPSYPPGVALTEENPDAAANIAKIASTVMDEIRENPSVCETVTYHPLLLETLHALLLCHCLLQYLQS